MRRFIKNFAAHLSVKNEYPKELEEQVEYALRITIFEALKIIGAVVIFTLLGHPVEAIAAVGTISVIRPFTGGYHEDTQIKCFMVTSAIIGSIIYLSLNLKIDLISKLILDIVSLFCIWNQAPIVHPKMPITKAELIKRNSTIGLLLCAAFIVISLALSNYDSVSNSITWVIVFQALLMFNKRSLRFKSNVFS